MLKLFLLKSVVIRQFTTVQFQENDPLIIVVSDEKEQERHLAYSILDPQSGLLYMLYEMGRSLKKSYKNIWQSIKSTFSFDNSATWWNISAGIVGASLDVSKRISIVDKFFIPFFNVLGVAATQAKFIIRNIGNHNGLFFIGSIIGRAHFNLKLFSKNAKDVLTARLPKEQMFDFSPKAAIKGSFIGIVVGGTVEIQKWMQNENNQKDITDLLANLTGMAIKTLIGTWLTVLLVSMLLTGGPVGLVIAVGVVVGIAIGWMLDYLDEYFGMTDNLKNLYNHLQSCTQNTLQDIVNKGNQLFGLNYTLSSWFY
ncbi:hypothetical protein F909_02945 [Acinetobacter sp. ANC 3929]|uniref:hypothetical protein n=1 Tax=unclassified Acinetobacter TaxID=196816 RepID=UPI0002CF76B6|nr:MULTISPECIES: hypothetical protein [unclassified Acinetobacter]ENW79841.1 hypothetical protein F909_02945 [Acinetobacter sp. ANC 3929]MCH7353858.1 hypothetical protein [Acinetobacter sp. NIPH 2023]MCH7354632.1 hypothetical protein [Acinetobacter sp. NIPH 1958]MCH7361188.1 hypothetical protein [Acinetobacter sp. NIPH 2024]